MRCCGGWMSGWMGTWLGVLSLLFVVVLLVGIALVAWVLHKREESGARSSAPGRGAPDILEQRYARGEVDRQEFEERRQALRSRDSGAG